jgi:type I restriction enzyme R subunit
MPDRNPGSFRPPEEPAIFFNPKVETAKVEGAFLPHWSQGGTVVFVTFRLADSLPQEKVRALAKEKEEWLKEHPEPHDEEQKAEFYRLFSARLQRWLDAGYGSMILARHPVKGIVEEALRHFDGVRYHLDEFAVAANHVHVLMAPKAGFTIPAILHSWKSFTAKEILNTLRAGGMKMPPTVWQQESWDHLVRSEHSLEKFRKYIRKH